MPRNIREGGTSNSTKIKKLYLRNTISQNDVLCENNNLYLPTGVAAFAELRRNKHLDENR